MKKEEMFAPQTGKIIEAISQLECIKPFVLVGGTALAIQLKTRQSEDLDFMRWKVGKDDKLEIGWPSIQHELETVGEIEDVQVLGFDQVIFVVEGVKLSFYAAPRKRIATMREIPFMGNIRMADIESIGVMKMESMMRRSKFRDYYDIYSILKTGVDVKSLILRALEHSGYRMKEKNLMAMLTNGDLFRKDEGFRQLHPVYDVTSSDIEQYIKDKLKA